MGNIFEILKSILMTRFNMIVRLFRSHTNPTVIKNKISYKIRDFFTGLMDVKPRSKEDYYTILWFMVSKRLVHFILIFGGVTGLLYLGVVKNSYFGSARDDGIKTYSYSSVFLRFVNSRVRIKGKSGYIAYDGWVKDGACEGNGTLYDPDGYMVYTGNFSNSMFEGSGKYFYENGTVCYDGEFHENLYEGDGALNRLNGSAYYTGQFHHGLKEGEGVLYNRASSPVYSGRFQQDSIVYTDIIGLEAPEINEKYTGEKTVYACNNEYFIHMKDIDAIYTGKTEADSLDDTLKAERVYVLSNKFTEGGIKFSIPSDLEYVFGKPVYEGNSNITSVEAVCISEIRKQSGDAFFGSVDLNLDNVYDDYIEIDGYDSNKVVYLYAYESGGIIYTFVCRDRNSPFGFYYLTKKNGLDEE